MVSIRKGSFSALGRWDRPASRSVEFAPEFPDGRHLGMAKVYKEQEISGNWFLLASQPQGGTSRSVEIVGYYM